MQLTMALPNGEKSTRNGEKSTRKSFPFRLEKGKDVWGTCSTYCIHHGRKVMLNTLLMFKTVSAIIFSWEKADWSPSFTSSVSAKKAVTFYLVCGNLHSGQEGSQAKCSLPLPPKGPCKDTLHLAKEVKVLGGPKQQQADGTILCLLGDVLM